MLRMIQGAVVRREFDHTYLLVPAKLSQTEDYPFLMITQNNIAGVLPCRLRYLEDSPYYGYDISSKRPLGEEYQDKRLHFEEIKNLFYQISSILKGAEEYLLEKEGFLLSPEYIYMDLETDALFCLYLPGVEEESELGKERYRALADFLLDKAEHKDEHAVNCVYQFYKMSKETYFSFESFLSFLQKEELLFQAEKRRREEKKQVQESQSSNGERELVEEDYSRKLHVYEEKEIEPDFREIRWLSVIITAVLGFCLLAFYLFVPYLRYFALYLLLPGICFIVVAAVLAGRNIYGIYQNKKETDWIMPTEEVTVEEYFDDMLDNETVFFEDEICYHLKWKEGHFSKEFYLKDLPVTVGKMKGSVGICIEDASISRLHACFKEQGKEIVLQDLDSTNGTYVNGKQLDPGEVTIIRRSDEIQFGKIIVNVV